LSYFCWLHKIHVSNNVVNCKSFFYKLAPTFAFGLHTWTQRQNVGQPHSYLLYHSKLMTNRSRSHIAIHIQIKVYSMGMYNKMTIRRGRMDAKDTCTKLISHSITCSFTHRITRFPSDEGSLINKKE